MTKPHRMDLGEAIAAHIVGDREAVIITGRIARSLVNWAEITPGRVAALRESGNDLPAYVQLRALREVALADGAVPYGYVANHVADSGNRTETAPYAQTRDHEGLSVRQAAEHLGIPERTVRHQCATGRLKARKHAGLWLIDPGQIATTPAPPSQQEGEA